jgi:hypothetical protein
MTAVRLGAEIANDALEAFDRFTAAMREQWPEVEALATGQQARDRVARARLAAGRADVACRLVRVGRPANANRTRAHWLRAAR